jgi:hypothetical protein
VAEVGRHGSAGIVGHRAVVPKGRSWRGKGRVMIVPCEVLEELTENFIGKRGPKSIALWVCLDRSPTGALRNTFDHEVNDDEQEKFGGKATGKIIEILITEIRMGFGGRARFKGTLRKFGGEEVQP